MNRPFALHKNFTPEPEKPLEKHARQPVPTADLVVLCCFGLELSGERTHEELRQALREAGFTGPLVRHSIKNSPLLERAAKRSYRLALPSSRP